MGTSSLIDLRLAGALAAALATLVASDKVSPTECPKTQTGSGSVKLAHETDCTKYYGCHDGSKIEMECPTIDRQGGRFYFNPVSQDCDWPKNVDCKTPQHPIAAIPSRVQIPTKCPSDNSPDYTVHLAHEKDCTRFYKCDWGEKIPFDCPFCNKKGERLYFNPVLQVCDWPRRVHCDNAPPGRIPCTANGSDGEPNDGCIGSCPIVDDPELNLLLANEDCKKFCICSDGVPYLHKCPKNLPYWNDSEKKCVASDAGCQKRQ